MSESEVRTAWLRSSRCGSDACVEIARIDDTYLVRDSKNPDAEPLILSAEQWRAFKIDIAAGTFDLD